MLHERTVCVPAWVTRHRLHDAQMWHISAHDVRICNVLQQDAKYKVKELTDENAKLVHGIRGIT